MQRPSGLSPLSSLESNHFASSRSWRPQPARSRRSDPSLGERATRTDPEAGLSAQFRPPVHELPQPLERLRRDREPSAAKGRRSCMALRSWRSRQRQPSASRRSPPPRRRLRPRPSERLHVSIVSQWDSPCRFRFSLALVGVQEETKPRLHNAKKQRAKIPPHRSKEPTERAAARASVRLYMKWAVCVPKWRGRPAASGRWAGQPDCFPGEQALLAASCREGGHEELGFSHEMVNQNKQRTTLILCRPSPVLPPVHGPRHSGSKRDPSPLIESQAKLALQHLFHALRHFRMAGAPTQAVVGRYVVARQSG